MAGDAGTERCLFPRRFGEDGEEEIRGLDSRELD
jgi:hypothetical protein